MTVDIDHLLELCKDALNLKDEPEFYGMSMSADELTVQCIARFKDRYLLCSVKFVYERPVSISMNRIGDWHSDTHGNSVFV
jgi:hypothetical protein